MNASRFAARVLTAWLAVAAGQRAARKTTPASAGGGLPLYGDAPTPNESTSTSTFSTATTCIARASVSTAARPASRSAPPDSRAAKRTRDEFFGEQEIYRRKFQVAIPYRRTRRGHDPRPEARAARLRDRRSAICRRTGRQRSRFRRRRSSAPARSTRPRPATSCPSTTRSR